MFARDVAVCNTYLNMPNAFFNTDGHQHKYTYVHDCEIDLNTTILYIILLPVHFTNKCLYGINGYLLEFKIHSSFACQISTKSSNLLFLAYNNEHRRIFDPSTPTTIFFLCNDNLVCTLCFLHIAYFSTCWINLSPLSLCLVGRDEYNDISDFIIWWHRSF